MKVKIKYKSKLYRFKNIDSRNKAFDSLSDEDKRREIAWDSLQLILSEKVSASLGEYWSNGLFSIEGDSKTLQKILLNELPECRVCARGAMMLSQIRLGNSIDSSDGYREQGTDENIKGFSMNDFYNMESEYENCQYRHPYNYNTDEKLANICCNIIVNGNFNTEDKTDYLLN